jgi:hypothetical protein
MRHSEYVFASRYAGLSPGDSPKNANRRITALYNEKSAQKSDLLEKSHSEWKFHAFRPKSQTDPEDHDLRNCEIP